MKILYKISSYISFVFCLASIVVSTILFTYTTDFKLEKLSYDICNYNKESYDNYDNSIISISFNTKSPTYKEYYRLQNTFNNNRFINSSRLISKHNYLLTSSNLSNQFNVKMISQSTFSKHKKSDDIFALDYNQYAVFNAYELSYANGNNFCFITEKIANSILNGLGYNDLNETNKVEYYKILCANKSNKGITLKYNSLDGAEFNLCVLGVIRSDYGAYASTKKAIGNDDFVLTWLPFKYQNYFEFTYDIDLKVNPYGNKKVLSFLMNNYSNESDYSMAIKQYDGNVYYNNNNLIKEYYNIIYASSRSSIYYNTAVSFLLVCFIAFFVFNIISFKHFNKGLYITSIFYYVLFLIYGIVANFIFVYPMTTLVCLVYLLNYIFLGKEKINEYVIKILSKIKEKFN